MEVVKFLQNLIVRINKDFGNFEKFREEFINAFIKKNFNLALVGAGYQLKMVN